MAYNQPDDITIQMTCGELLKKAQNSKYLGGWVASSEQDFEIRKALAWSACNKMKKIWKSNMNRKIKVRLFRLTCWISPTGQLRDLGHKQKHAEKNRSLLHQNPENGNQYIMERENKQWSSLSRPTATFPNNKGKKNETSKSLHNTHYWDVTQTFPLE